MLGIKMGRIPRWARYLPVLACIAVDALVCTGAHAQPLEPPPTVSPRALPGLLATLKAGGHILYFRHLDTRQDQEDDQPVNLQDCSRQRNLSPEGEARGREIARVLAKAGVRFDPVLVSPFCRTRESGRLIFGKTLDDPDLFFAIGLNDAEKAGKGTALRRLLARTPAKGANTAIVGHTANLQEAVGLWPKPEGVAYVFRPDGQGGFAVIARIPPEAWASAPR